MDQKTTGKPVHAPQTQFPIRGMEETPDVLAILAVDPGLTWAVQHVKSVIFEMEIFLLTITETEVGGDTPVSSGLRSLATAVATSAADLTVALRDAVSNPAHSVTEV